MKIGRFFSLQQGYVGQYLSPRVLLVRTPFQIPVRERLYFGFDQLHQAQKFARSLAALGYRFQLGEGRLLTQPYEIQVEGEAQLAKTLAYWDRKDQQFLALMPTH